MSRIAIFTAVAILVVGIPLSGICAPASPTKPDQSDAISDLQSRQTAVEHDLAAEKEAAQERAKTLRDESQKDMATLKSDIDSANLRINDLKDRFGDLSLYLGLAGTALTLLGIGIGVLAYKTAGQKARSEAEEWLSKHTSELSAKIYDLDKKMAEVTARMDAAATETERQGKEIRDRMQESLNAGQAPMPSAVERETLKAAEAFKSKPESQYTANDWAERAFAAYAEQKIALAAEYFAQAAHVVGATPVQQAQFLFNRASLLDQLDRHQEEIVAYDELAARFKDASEPALREQVGKALFNKGVTLGQLGRDDEAIAVYDGLIASFVNAGEPALLEQVGRALVNKGFILNRLGRKDEAIAVYDDVIARFKDASEPALREQAAKALVNKGVALGGLGREDEAIVVYDDLIARFKDVSEPILREQVGNALFNKGVVLSELGRKDEAIAVCDDFIARFKDASELPLRKIVESARKLKEKLEKQ